MFELFLIFFYGLLSDNKLPWNLLTAESWIGESFAFCTSIVFTSGITVWPQALIGATLSIPSCLPCKSIPEQDCFTTVQFNNWSMIQFKSLTCVPLLFYDPVNPQKSTEEKFEEIQHPPSVYENAQNVSVVDCFKLESFCHNMHNIWRFVPPPYMWQALLKVLDLWQSTNASPTVPKVLWRTWQTSLDPRFQVF